MDAVQILETTQQQASAAWVDYLNQLRLNELFAKLTSQDINLEQALAELEKMKVDIVTRIIERNRGGSKGMHGFIAEAAEVGIENARNLIRGLDAVCRWVDDNGETDLIRGNTKIQQKFVKEFFSLSENGGVLEHKSDYPWFVKQGGKYQIPKDFYETLMRLRAMPQEEAGKLVANSPEGQKGLTYSNWKKVQAFFENSGITPDEIEPSLLKYDEVQQGSINQTISKEEASIKETDQQIRDAAYEASKPTLEQGAQVAAVSAAAEGGMQFCLGVAKKLKSGKRLHEFTAKDWKDIGVDTAKATAKGGIRGGAVYAMTNFTATPAAVANALVTASFGVAAQAYQLRQGTISAEDFIVNSEVLCMDVSVSAVASLLGQTLIPVPVLGAIIGNVAGMFMYQIAKDHLSEAEQTLIANYRADFANLNKMLEERYNELVAQLKKEFAKYVSIVELAFDPDVNIAFDGSIVLADHVGVPSEKVLRSKKDIDNYFLS